MAVRWEDHLPLQEGRDSSSWIITARINRPRLAGSSVLFLSLVRIYVTGGIEKLKEGKTQEAYKAPYAPFTRARVICA